MNETHHFVGRANPAVLEYPAETVQADAGHVFCLLVQVGDMEIVTYYTRMAVMDYWGMRIVNPFRRLAYKNISRDYADYLPKDLLVFCPALIQQIPEEEWMLRDS